jgi:hypothetical protein
MEFSKGAHTLLQGDLTIPLEGLRLPILILRQGYYAKEKGGSTMKGNIKKLAVFVIVAAITMFIAMAMASADSHKGHKTIHGEYAITGSGSCFIAINGFNASLQPNDGPNGMWLWGPLTYDEGSITFYKDGTGSLTCIFHAFDSWSPFFVNLGFPPDAGSATETWNFTYTMTDSHNMTINYVKGSYELNFTSGPNVGTPLGVSYIILPPVKGVISPDEKILFASWGAPAIMEFTNDKENNDPNGTQAICSVVIQGMRIGP